MGLRGRLLREIQGGGEERGDGNWTTVLMAVWGIKGCIGIARIVP